MTRIAEPSIPAAAYGKSADGRDEYGILWTQQGFSDVAQQALRNLSRSYQFLGGDSSSAISYPDCFALWPVENGGWIAARLRDAGRDSLGRPHTLRIDAVFIEANVALAERSRLIGFLEPDGWPTDTFDPQVAVRILPAAVSTRLADSLADFQPATSTATVLRAFSDGAFHKRVRHSFKIVLDAHGDLVSTQTPIANPMAGTAATNHLGTHNRAVSPTSKPVSRESGWSRSLLVKLVTGVIFLLVGAGGGFVWQKTGSDEAIRNLQAELSSREEQHQRELADQQRLAQESYDSLLTQAKQMKQSEDSFKALAAEFGFTNVADLETELRRRGLPSRPSEPSESRAQRVRRLYESLGTELFSPASASPAPPSSNGNPIQQERKSLLDRWMPQ